jgi:hypothetical protein
MAGNQAKYGIGQYGSASYGEIPVTAKAPLDVSKSGAIFGSAVYGTNTYGGTITETHKGIQALNGFNPEFGLTLDGALPEGQIDGSFTGRTQNIVFAGEVQLPSSITAAGCLWEHGGAGIGSWLGVFLDPDDSNIPKLRFRAGEGASSVQDNTAGDIALQNVAISDIPEFDGNTHTVVFDIKPSAPGRIRLWIDGREVINQETSGGGQLEGGSWSGGDTGGWGSGYSSIAGVTNGTGGSNSYQTDADWPGTIVSDLRYYAGELASTVSVSVVSEANIVPTSTSATGSVTTATIAGDANLSLTGVSASGTTDPDVVITADATHTVTSVQGTSATGTVGTVGVAIHQVDGVEGTGNTTTATISGDSNLTTASVSASGNVTTVTTTADSNTSVTGVEATGAVGDAESLVNITAAVTGVEATATAGDVDVFTGTFVTVPVTGLEATGSVTTVTVTADAVADNLTGVEATSTVNDTLVFIGDANFTLPSTEATGQTTTATVAADANTTTGSVQATATADPDVVIEGDALHTITSVQGVTATGGVGDVVAGANIDSVAGVEATAIANTATISAGSVVTPQSVEGTGQTTTAIVSADANLDVTGVEGTGEVTTVDISIPKNVDVTGVGATGAVTTTTISGDNNVTSPSVSAIATADPDVVIEGDALHTITSVQGVSATGGIGDVTAEANIDVVEGVEATASVTTVVAIAKATASVSGVEGTSAVNDVTVSTTNVVVVDFVTGQILANTATVSGDANLELTSVEATPELTAPIVNASAVAVSPAIEIDSTLGTLTVAGTVFDYEAQKENYSKRRTVYLPRAA